MIRALVLTWLSEVIPVYVFLKRHSHAVLSFYIHKGLDAKHPTVLLNICEDDSMECRKLCIAHDMHIYETS